MFFNVLKEGCRVEQLQLGDTGRLQTALALYMIIAWRINRLMRLGCNLPADLLFGADEWRAAFILNKNKVPKAVPPANTVIRLIAPLGGFWAERATVSRGPRRFGGACATSPSLCRACATPVNSGRQSDLCITDGGEASQKPSFARSTRHSLKYDFSVF